MKKFLIFITLLFFLTPTIILPQINVDSLKEIYNNSISSDEKLALALKITSKLLENNNTEALYYLTEAEKLLQSFPDSLKLGSTKYYFGKYYLGTSDYEKAARYFMETLDIAEKCHNDSMKEKTLNTLAVLHMQTSNFAKGIEIFEELLKMAKEENNPEDINIYSLNLAIAYGSMNEFEKAKELLLEIYNSENGDNYFRTVAANGLSYIYNIAEDFQNALKYAKEADKLFKEPGTLNLKIEILTNYSNALKGLGKTGKAQKIILEIIELAKENKAITEMNNAIGNLATNYAKTGDFENAYRCYKDFAERRDSLLNESTTETINELQIKYETEKKDREIERNNIILKEKNTALFYSISGALFFIAVSIIIFILYFKKNAAYKEIVRKNLEIIQKEECTTIAANDPKEKEEKSKYQTSSLSEEKKKTLRKKLLSLTNEEKIYLQLDLTLQKLANLLETNSKYLSQVIHEFYGMSFSDFINRLRVFEAARLLSNPSYKHITMEGISELVGFNTKSSFNIYFKKFMGVTPSFFSKTSLEINNENIS